MFAPAAPGSGRFTGKTSGKEQVRPHVKPQSRPAGSSRRRRLVAAAAVAAVAAAASLASIATAAETTLPIAPIKILVHGNTGNGDFFVSPFGDATTYANGAEIVDPSGKVVWFHQVPAPEEAADFRVQTYEGQPVLTFWQGVGAGGHGAGIDYIYNAHYEKIAEVKAGNGQSADVHEFEITPQGTALIPAYYETTADLTSIGGPSNQKDLNEVVQESHIKTGKLLFEWNPQQHTPASQSEQPLPAAATTAWDWFHM